MDFNELENQSKDENRKKNRLTLIALFVLFVSPVAIAYFSYFNGWFSGTTKNHGQLLNETEIFDIEDYEFIRPNNKKITGKEFETLYWWLMPIDPAFCDNDCLKINLHLLKQTYIGLGKERKRLNPLLVLPKPADIDLESFPIAFSQFSQGSVSVLSSRINNSDVSVKPRDLPANFIYLVDPLGNIMMRYPLVKDEKNAAEKSQGLRRDILRLFKYSRLG